MTEKYLMVDLHDPRTAAIADVLANKTAKRILDVLAERELSVTELANKLHSPLNTIDYNVKKLREAGLIEPAKAFWSVKGKRMPVYRVSHKNIMISPRRISKGVVPALIGSVLVAVGLKVWTDTLSVSAPVASVGPSFAASEAAGAAAKVGTTIVQPATSLTSTIADPGLLWAWFLLGALVALLVVLLWQSFSVKGGHE